VHCITNIIGEDIYLEIMMLGNYISGPLPWECEFIEVHGNSCITYQAFTMHFGCHISNNHIIIILINTFDTNSKKHAQK